jgi:hypothetical protein
VIRLGDRAYKARRVPDLADEMYWMMMMIDGGTMMMMMTFITQRGESQRNVLNMIRLCPIHNQRASAKIGKGKW